MEIICPQCKTVIPLDETVYAQIAQKVRDSEFAKEMRAQKQALASSNEKELQIARMELSKELEDKNKEVARLKQQIEMNNVQKTLDVKEAVDAKQQEVEEKKNEIERLKDQLQDANKKHEKEVDFYLGQIEQLKDFRFKVATKVVGENLEQHCKNEFDKIRQAAFPHAYFEKDNDARTGSKGDFIFRESEDGVEFISIMFEMKNEMETTVTKHKNEDFFKELDKDRREKGCEYAVLVSMLERESELYNTGIVDVSHIYPKMYVVRPDFMIPLISLLRNAAKNSLVYRKKLKEAENQQLDISRFERNMNDFRNSFNKNYEKAGVKYKAAIDGIDDAIKKLERIKEALVASETALTKANQQIDELTIKKLAVGAPSVRKMFAEAHKGEE